MESQQAVAAFAALAQASRLDVVRALARAPDGLAAGEIAERLQVPPPTLSFHLQQLVRAGLVRVRRQGRRLIHTIDGATVRQLFWFLGEDCCQGRDELCESPLSRIEQRRREAAAPAAKPNVLFVCSHNSARSQLAEAILRHEAGDRFAACSGGVDARPVHPLTLRVLAEAGIDAAGLRSQDLGDFLGKVPIHHAIVVCEEAQQQCPRLHPFAAHLHCWPFPDPAAATGSQAQRLAAFRSVRDAIRTRIRAWLREQSSTGTRRSRTQRTGKRRGRAAGARR